MAITFSLFAFNGLSKEIKVAAPEIPPFIHVVDGKVSGTLASCMKNSDKVDIAITVMPWARAVHEVKMGRFDAIMPAIKTPAREQYLTFPEKPVVQFLDDGLVKSKTQLVQKNKYVIGKLRSSPTSDHVLAKFDQHGIKNYEFFESVDFAALINMLLEHRIDYIMGDLNILKQTARTVNQYNELEFIEVSDNARYSYLAFSKQLFNLPNANLIMESLDCPIVTMK
jgi:ABC-type amino acid transport substrate-binding protein